MYRSRLLFPFSSYVLLLFFFSFSLFFFFWLAFFGGQLPPPPPPGYAPVKEVDLTQRRRRRRSIRISIDSRVYALLECVIQSLALIQNHFRTLVWRYPTKTYQKSTQSSSISRGAGPRINIVCINEDRLRKRGWMRPQKKGSSTFSQTFYISDRRVSDVKNGFRDDFLEAFYMDFVQRLSVYER